MGKSESSDNLGVDVTNAILAHYGTRGMRWGVRNSAQKHAGQITDRAIRMHKKALSGTGVVGKVAMTDKYTWGRNGKFEGFHNARISELERSKERIAKGEILSRTILFGAQYSKPAKKG